MILMEEKQLNLFSSFFYFYKPNFSKINISIMPKYIPIVKKGMAG